MASCARLFRRRKDGSYKTSRKIRGASPPDLYFSPRIGHFKCYSAPWYWEHLGMLGVQEYDEDWIEKRKIYESMGIMDRVITTFESGALSKMANEKVRRLKALN